MRRYILKAMIQLSILMVLNLVVLIAWLYFYFHYGGVSNIQILGYFTLFGKCLLDIFLSTLGFLGLLNRKMCINVTYLNMIGYSFLFPVVLGIVPPILLSNVLANGEPTRDYIRNYFRKFNDIPFLMTEIQSTSECCGVYGYKDYISSTMENKTQFNFTVPASCCHKVFENKPRLYGLCNPKVDGFLNEKGCFVIEGTNTLKSWNSPFMNTIFWWIILPPIFIFFFQIFAYGTYHFAVLQIRYDIFQRILQARAARRDSHGPIIKAVYNNRKLKKHGHHHNNHQATIINPHEY